MAIAPTAELNPNLQPATIDEAGSSSMASDLMNDLTNPKPIDAAPVPDSAEVKSDIKEVKPADSKPVAATAEKPKPVTKPEPTKPVVTQPAKPVAAITKPIDIDDPKVPAAELRKHLKDIQAKSAQTISEKEAAAAKLSVRLAELEKRRYWSEDDEKEVSAKTQRLAQLEADIYGRDYTQSPEFKKNFQDKLDNQFKDAVDVFGALTITEGEATRAATNKDVLKVLNAPSNSDRRKLAKEMFGEDFQEVLDAVQPMIETQRLADVAVKEKASNYQSEAKQKADEQTSQSKQMQELVALHSAQLAEKHPDVWKPEETDQESKDLLKRGFDFIDESHSKKDMDINERAARIALIRNWAGGFPLVYTEKNKYKALAEERLAIIERYQSSDPSNAGESGSGSAATDSSDKGGVDALAAEIDAMNVI